MLYLYTAWIGIAGITVASMTTPDDLANIREVFAAYPDVPYWTKFMMAYFITLVVVLVWPVFVIRSFR